MTSPTLAELTDRDQEMLETLLVEFDTSWQPDSLSTWADDKLPEQEPLRRLALVEMVRVDMEKQWEQGRHLTLGSYLERFPELGTVQTIPSELIFAEYQVRQQFGAPVELSEYARRFPRQAAELSRLVQEFAATQSDPSQSIDSLQESVSAHETSRAPGATDTTGATGGPRDLPESFGRYRILRKLGHGGMGAVYLAHDTQLDRQVALKVPKFSATERKEVVERFLREARSMATIRHPNLCPVYDVGEIDGIQYLTMAYIEGRLLSEVIKSKEPLPQRATATLIRKLALALKEAHARGIVHRDLKPSNVFVDERGGPVIVDFGLARRMKHQDVALTQSGEVLGSPAYIAPEQVQSQAGPVGTHSDIYSLGVIMYELLTGLRPFRGEQVLDVLGQVLTAEPESPRVHRPDLDSRLETVCRKAMAKRAADRYPTMQDMADPLGEYLQVAQAGSSDRAAAAERSVPGDVDESTGHEESYGLTEAVAGLSQLLQDMPSSPAWDAEDDDRSYVIPTIEDGKNNVTNSPAASAPGPAQGSRGRRRIPPWVLLAACGAAAVLGIVILLFTGHGTVRIELSDPQANVEVKVDGEEIRVEGLAEPLSLRVGEHQLVVTGSAFETVTRSFSLKRGADETLRISLISKPAVYNVSIGPPDARLSVSGEGATVAGDGATRTVTVANPDGQRKIVVLARKIGFQDLERELQPVPGQSTELEFQLQPVPQPTAAPASTQPPDDLPVTPQPTQPAPAVFTVEIEPAGAMLYVSGRGARLDGEGAKRTVTVVNPDGKSPVVLVAAAEGYQGDRREFRPVAGETQIVTFRLRRMSENVAVAPPKPAPPPADKKTEAEPTVVAGDELPTITNSLGMKMVLIPAGEFLMGPKVLDPDAEDDELPQHRVRITQPFYLGTHEVTQAQFRQFVEDALYKEGAEDWRKQFLDGGQGDYPVVCVNGHDAMAFCKWLSEKEGKSYRLPTEAEWEYACRAGTQTPFSFGDDEKQLDDFGWYSANSSSTVHAVGKKKPNPWGLYDMHGNVWEWCTDWYDSDYYAGSPTDDPTGPASGSYRVRRGGCWFNDASGCRASRRDWNVPGGRRDDYLGFRLARTVSHSPSR